ncbi:hypothetical protein C8J56DRAFT_1038979 [Mycena floridula]|nr:hypothetical protein C8J56DRAFT_1038979 [Mycena floridula]
MHPGDQVYNIAAFLCFSQHVQYLKTGGLAYISDYQGASDLLTDPQIMTSLAPQADAVEVNVDAEPGPVLNRTDAVVDKDSDDEDIILAVNCQTLKEQTDGYVDLLEEFAKCLRHQSQFNDNRMLAALT